MRLAALEVAPHALTLSLLCGGKMHEDCEGITRILPLITELEETFNSDQKQNPRRQRTLTIPYSGMRGEEEEKGGRKDWGLRVTLATEVGVCIVPCVLVILEDIKACRL